MIIDESYIQEHLLADKITNRQSMTACDSSQESRKAFNAIERLIRVRDRAVEEVRRRLSQDKYPPEVIEEAIDRALTCGYLDDTRFAESYIFSHLNAGKGLEGIIRDLKQLKIDVYALEGFPHRFLPEHYDAVDAALALLQKKPPRSKNRQQGAYAKLMRAGYSSSVAYEAVFRWSASIDSL